MSSTPKHSSDNSTWLEAIEIAVHAFRIGIEGVAHEQLAVFLEHLQPLLQQHPQLIQDASVVNALQMIYSAQQRGDELLIADLLEYELAPRLLQLQASPQPGNR